MGWLITFSLMEFIRKLTDLDKDDIALAGGKGANLGELNKAGVPVPPGFVITTAAYDLFITSNRLVEAITENLHHSSTIRDAFCMAPLQVQIEQAVVAAYQDLGQGAVAVRSSATAEDLPEAAFAGQQDTFLNIIGKEALLDAVRQVWASLWTERAIAYRDRLGIDHRKVKLAVVVQRMAEAEFAGVMFTANPVTGTRHEIVIEANPGLGEAVVSGLVTPDHFELRKQRGRWIITRRQSGRREVMISAKPGGGTEHVETPIAVQLPDTALMILARLGEKIQQFFGAPQDIEWVWTGKTIFIVQSRPITALPEPLPRQGRISRLLSGVIAEIIPARPLPLEAVMIDMLVEYFLKPFFRLMGLKYPAAEDLLVVRDGVPVRITGHVSMGLRPGLLLAPFRLVQSALRYDPLHWQDDPAVAKALAAIRTLEKQNLAGLPPDNLVKKVGEARDIFSYFMEVRIHYLPRVLLAMVILRLLLALTGSKACWGTLLFSGIDTTVTRMNRALEELASQIRSNPTLADLFTHCDAKELLRALDTRKDGQDFLHTFYAFLDEYGYREVGGTFLISQPIWKDAPEVVLGILQSLLVSAQPQVTPRAFSWEEARDEILVKPFLRPFRAVFMASLNTARRFHEIREDTRFYAMMAMPVLRRMFLAAGWHLCEIGIMNRSDDVYWLTWHELEAVLKDFPPSPADIDRLRTLIARRKVIYEELKNLPFVDPRLFRITGVSHGAALVGMPGSPGAAEGVVRVIHSSAEFGKLRAGDVLVAPYTNPAWTPLFQRAVAVVVDSGGAMSHAAIVAREYGIPAVMGTTDGTVKLKDGDRIRVDGTLGQVFILPTKQ